MSPYLKPEAVEARVRALRLRLAAEYERAPVDSCLAWAACPALRRLGLAYWMDPDDRSGLVSVAVRRATL